MRLSNHDLIVLLSSIAVMLMLSRLFAELGRMVKLPVVMGEILVGILLGPTVLGALAPGIYENLFPENSPVNYALDGITSLSVIMLLFVAGLEVQLQIMLKQGKTAAYTSIMSMIIPFALGFGAVYLFPGVFGKMNDQFVYAMFFGTAMAVSALPVITRILMDMNLFKTRVGMIIIAAAIFVDLTGWLIFSFILSYSGQDDHMDNVWYTIGMILGFGLFMLVIGKRLIDQALPWIQRKLSWPGGVLSISLGFCFLGAAFTEHLGLHAILGAFIMGIAFGDSVHLHEKAREIIHQFVMNIFAPLFFVSLGLKVNFFENFDLTLVLVVLVIAVVLKVLGGSIGAFLGGLSRKESLAVGFGLNARGAMEIILGSLALNSGLINEEMFVALVLMALVTSMISGPAMKKLLD